MANLGYKLLQPIDGMRNEVLYDIFVYTHKVYDALDWGGATYKYWKGVGWASQVFQLLTQYWYQETMVTRVSR